VGHLASSVRQAGAWAMQSQQPDDAMPAAMPGSESASELHGARAHAKARQCAEGQGDNPSGGMSGSNFQNRL